MRKTVLIGTRTSRLAKWQARWVINQLQGLFDQYRFQMVEIPTKGDESVLEPFTFPGYDIFSKEVEHALIGRDVDLAVHSMRDLPYNLSPRLAIGAVVSRSDPANVLISNDHVFLNEIPHGALIGTSSSLRRAQLLKFRDDLNVLECRGYIKNRLNRLHQGEMDAIVLAAASVERLGLDINITEYLPYAVCMPAPGQGAIGVEIRCDDMEMLEMIRMLHNSNVAYAVAAERAVAKYLGGKRYFPVGALGRFKGHNLHLEAIALSYDGQESVWADAAGYPADPEELGAEVAERLLNGATDRILRDLGREIHTD